MQRGMQWPEKVIPYIKQYVIFCFTSQTLKVENISSFVPDAKQDCFLQKV